MVGEVECEPIIGELVGGVASEPIENICTLGEDGGWVWIRVPSREARLIGEVVVEEG